MSEKEKKKSRAKSVESVCLEAGLEERDTWGSQTEFILTTVGYAVGLGNVWRFPYMAFQNGGGAFLIPYFVFLIIAGIPIFFFEVCLGQFSSLGPLKVWILAPICKGVGYGLVMVQWFVTLYYHLLIAYILHFIVSSFSYQLPWSTCNNNWNNNKTCATNELLQNQTLLDEYLSEHNLTKEVLTNPSEEYFYNKVLKMSSGAEELGSIVPELAGYLALSWFITFLVLIKGVKILGKVVYFTSTFPYIMMTVMVVRACTLDGAIDGIEFYLKPNMTQLTNVDVWSSAASQIIFSLSTCTGGLIAMASYNNFHNNLSRDTLIVPTINCLTSLFSGFAIFPVLGFMAKKLGEGVTVADVADGGPGLIFIVYPEGLSNMPGENFRPLWAVLFFFMMVTLGFSSVFSMTEGIFTSLVDEMPNFLRVNKFRPMIFRGVLSIFFYLISLPLVTQGGYYIFKIMDEYAGGIPRCFMGMAEILAVVFVYGYSKFAEDIEIMLGKKPNIYFNVTWLFFAPASILAVLVAKILQVKPLELFDGAYVYPWWGNLIGWAIFALIFGWLPAYSLSLFLINKCNWRKCTQPDPMWGPARLCDRTGKYSSFASKNKSADKKTISNIYSYNPENGITNNGFHAHLETKSTRI